MIIFLAGHFTTMIDFVTWPPLQISNDGTKGDKVNHNCENTL